MNWIDAQALHDIGLKQIEEGIKNISKAHDIMERINAANNTEVPIRPIKEGKIECERGDMYNERPYVQLQSGDYGALSQQLTEARERHKYKGE